jgi:hypothetical protein
MNIGSLYIEFILIIMLYLNGIWQKINNFNNKNSLLNILIKIISFLIIFFIFYISGLCNAILDSWQYYPYSLIELIAKGYISIWGLFVVYLLYKPTKKNMQFIPSFLAAIVTLSIFHNLNLETSAYIVSHPITFIDNISLENIIYHFSILIGIGIIKSISKPKLDMPWSFILIFSFCLLILANLKNYDISIAQEFHIVFKQLYYIVILFPLLYFINLTKNSFIFLLELIIVIVLPVFILNFF